MLILVLIVFLSLVQILSMLKLSHRQFLVLTTTFGLLLHQNLFLCDLLNTFDQELECLLFLDCGLVDVVVLATQVLESERDLLLLFVSGFL